MGVVFLRCEIQLGYVQAERQRWGFVKGDANNAVHVAIEAQGMAEHLDDSQLIGRASFWRGVAEFMAGNNIGAEGCFETSASYPWASPEKERGLLQEWWNVSKTEHVDQTSHIDHNPKSPQMPQKAWSELSKRNKSDSKKGKRDKKLNKDKKDKKHKRSKRDTTTSKDGKPKDEKSKVEKQKDKNHKCSTQ
jgi:hypothetical protein